MVRAGAKDLMNPLHAELLACSIGVRMATSMGLPRIELETDATIIKGSFYNVP